MYHVSAQGVDERILNVLSSSSSSFKVVNHKKAFKLVLLSRAQHIKCPKECCLLGQNTCKCPLSSYKMTLKQ